MKKYILSLIIIFCSISGFSQVTQWRLGIDSASGNPHLYHDTIYTLPYTTTKYFNGYGAWGSFYDTARAAISYTGTGYLSYNSTSGVLTGSAVNLTSHVTGVLPEANGGTNQSTYATGDILYASATNTLSKLAHGTTAQRLVWNGSALAWRDTAVAGGGGGAGDSAYFWNLRTGNIGTHIPDSSIWLGTNNDTHLRFKTNRTTRILIDSAGNMGFGLQGLANSTIVQNSAYRSNFYGGALVGGNPDGSSGAAKLAINSSGAGSIYELSELTASTGSGQTTRTSGYLIIAPSTGAAHLVGIGTTGRLSVGALNDETGILNINTVSGTAGTLNFNQNGVNRWSLNNIATTGDFRLLNSSTVAWSVNNSTFNTIFGGTTDNKAKLQTTSFGMGYAAKGTSYTLVVGDHTINVTATGQTMTLPTAVGCTGLEYTIKLTASGSSTVATTSSQTIDGSTTYSLSAQYKYVTVQSDGANWIIIANN